MAIGKDAGVWFFGVQDVVSSGSTAAITDNGFAIADQGTSINWTNDDDATEGSAVLELDFPSSVTVGNILLIARLFNMNSDGDDAPIPTLNYEHVVVGAFPLDYTNTAAYRTPIPNFQMPMILSAQRIDWYLKNNGTGVTLDAGWKLWVAPKAVGAHA